MTSNLAIQKTIDEFSNYCENNNLTFVVVGSVAYKRGSSNPDCDDLDCVIICDNVSKIKELECLSDSFRNEAFESLSMGEVDLIATKFNYNQVPVSLDILTKNYFEKICSEDYKTDSVFVKKMTDAEESYTNDYYDWLGNQFIYRKPKLRNRGFNIYILPTFMHEGQLFYSGVMQNKYIHNPWFVHIYNEEIPTLALNLVKNYAEYFKNQKKINPNFKIEKSIRRWNSFSDESKEFIKQYFG